MKKISVLILASVTGLSACKTTPWPWHPDGKVAYAYDLPCRDAPCEADDARRALSAASNFCLGLINESRGSKAWIGGSQVALSTIGAVSGGVIAQFAEGSASKAWAGVAGATNGVRSSLDEAFAGAIFVQRKHAVALAAQEGARKVLAAPIDDPDRRVDLAMQMATECAAAAAESDAKVFQAISGAPRLSPEEEQQRAAAERQRIETERLEAERAEAQRRTTETVTPDADGPGGGGGQAPGDLR